MSLDATFLLALVTLAAAALVVGVCGWVLFVRDHRAWKVAHAHGDPPGAEPQDVERH